MKYYISQMFVLIPRTSDTQLLMSNQEIWICSSMNKSVVQFKVTVYKAVLIADFHNHLSGVCWRTHLNLKFQV